MSLTYLHLSNLPQKYRIFVVPGYFRILTNFVSIISSVPESTKHNQKTASSEISTGIVRLPHSFEPRFHFPCLMAAAFSPVDEYSAMIGSLTLAVPHNTRHSYYMISISAFRPTENVSGSITFTLPCCLQPTSRHHPQTSWLAKLRYLRIPIVIKLLLSA